MTTTDSWLAVTAEIEHLTNAVFDLLVPALAAWALAILRTWLRR